MNSQTGLFVYPLVSRVVGVLGDLLVIEPQGNFVAGTFVRVRAVDNVATHFHAKVTADGTGERVVGVGGTNDSASTEHDTFTFPHHRDDGTRAKVLDQLGEEGLGLQVIVVLSGKLFGRHNSLDSDQLVALIFESLDDLTHQTALHAVGLHSNEGALVLGSLAVSSGSNVNLREYQ